MKKITIILIILILLLSITLGVYYFKSQRYYIPVETPSKIIDVSNSKKIDYIPLSKRNETKIIDYYDESFPNIPGDKKIIFFWSSGCKYCMEEFETILKVQEKFKDDTFILISHDSEKNDLENCIKENNANLFIIYNPSKNIRSILNSNDKQIPSIYVLDKENRILNQTHDILEEKDMIDFINVN